MLRWIEMKSNMNRKCMPCAHSLIAIFTYIFKHYKIETERVQMSQQPFGRLTIKTLYQQALCRLLQQLTASLQISRRIKSDSSRC